MFVLVFFSPYSIAGTLLGGEDNYSWCFSCVFDFRLFGFVCFFFLFVSGMGCGL